MFETWKEWACEGSAWMPCGTWDEGGGWTVDHATDWIGKGEEIAIDSTADTVEAVIEAVPDVLDTAATVTTGILVVGGLAAAGYLLRAVL